LRARVDTLGDPLLAGRGVQVVLRLPRTRRGTRGQNELGQDEPGDDESAGNDGEAVDRAKKTERREDRPDLNAATKGASALRPAAARAREGGIALFDGKPDEGDRACDGDGRGADDRRDRERLGRIAG